MSARRLGVAPSEKEGYKASLQSLDWESALRTVVEPWQLMVVINMYDEIDGERFNDHLGGRDSRSHNIDVALDRHKCDEARRDELRSFLTLLGNDEAWRAELRSLFPSKG